MSNTPKDTLFASKGVRFVLQLIIIVSIALVATNLASQAAFLEEPPSRPLSTNTSFWKAQDEINDDSKNIARADTRLKESEKITTSTPPPRVGASSYIVANLDTGQVLAKKHPDTPRPIASITKLMTAVVADETISGDNTISISSSAVNTEGHAGGLVAGDRFALKTLYYPLLLESSNDAATAIAEHKGKRRFVNLMNRKALALRMGTTQFADPSGLSPNNTATARDLLRLSQYIHEKKPFIFDITTRLQKAVPRQSSDGLRTFSNNNPLKNQARFEGGKNGYTDAAKYTLLSLFSIPVDQKEHTVAVIVLGSENHVEDTQRLLSWLRRFI